ncbi:energy-coupling factor ABC transporter permease [Nocardioides sp. 1609]|uniref:energy-coupling factor ABC transporter permease n=1 Tax=Nocardioides sp. 1609 TaxID=2508327 RepID=UPI00106F4868|nr:energy-coupling factor ABC transporter permease [Nocardioides sp. 1609]
MHVPDGFLDAPTSVATGVVAAGVVATSLRKARAELDDRTAPLAGLVAAFIFATQMLNFPVAGGTSGHLMGGAIAAVLVGPWTGLLATAVVFLVQSLLFADGGITALGTNVLLMGAVTVAVGWGVFRAVQTVLPKTTAMVPIAAGIGAFASVPVASVAFVGLYAVGGTADIPLDNLTTAMVGVHLLIGVGEGIITFLAVGSVIAVRPDLVHGARRVLEARELEVRTTRAAA